MIHNKRPTTRSKTRKTIQEDVIEIRDDLQDDFINNLNKNHLVFDANFTKDLAAWFIASRRELPWRVNRTPYRVWLSEVMLQQTQVSRVIEYFEKFTTRFQTVTELANASDDEVLSMWSGLGYYSRGRNLHKAAQKVVNEFHGIFPHRYEDLIQLPGIGKYTAAAIASFSSGQHVAVVDGNVQRVLSRITNEERAVSDRAVMTEFEKRAQELIEHAPDSALHNEAMIELGALICSPKKPRCDSCPVMKYCQARKHNCVEQRPVKIKSKPRKSMRLACVVIEVNNELYIEQRAKAGLFGGLWEPITQIISQDDDIQQAWKNILNEREIDRPKRWPKPIVAERTLTHRELCFEVLKLSFNEKPNSLVNNSEGKFVNVSDFHSVGMSNAVKAVFGL